MIAAGLIFVPLILGLFCLISDQGRRLTVATTALNLLLAATLVLRHGTAGLSFDLAWLPSLGIHLTARGDGAVVGIILAVAVAYMAAALFRSKDSSPARAALLLSESGAMAVLLAGSLPMMLIGWALAWVPLGGSRPPRRRMTLFMAVSFGCLFAFSMLVASKTGTWALPIDAGAALPKFSVLLLLGAVAAGSALFPLHTWLAGVTEKGRPGESAIVTAVISKLPLVMWFKLASGPVLAGLLQYNRWIIALILLTSIHAALVGWTQRHNLRALAAPLNIGVHALAALGLMSLDHRAVAGAILLLTGHSLAMTGLWALIELHERTDTHWRPGAMATAAMVLGAPGTALFAGLLLTWMGSFDSYATFVLKEQVAATPVLLLPHARLWTMVAMVIWFLLPAATVIAFYERFYRPPRHPDKVPTRPGVLAGVLLPFGVSLAIGLYPNLVLSHFDDATAQATAARAKNEHLRSTGSKHRAATNHTAPSAQPKSKGSGHQPNNAAMKATPSHAVRQAASFTLRRNVERQRRMAKRIAGALERMRKLRKQAARPDPTARPVPPAHNESSRTIPRQPRQNGAQSRPGTQPARHVPPHLPAATTNRTGGGRP
ncbi:MAG: hypothetical protein J7M25_02680 [Deltaproteobacteria bacterium]|nr:hypothetical protein [Deltaproteobacteria bacterium]